MNSRKTSDNNSSATKMSWFQGSVFSAASFAVVLIANRNPVHAIGLQLNKTYLN